MNYISKHTPYVHQAEALHRLENQSAFALLMAMRTGKTKVTLDDFGRLESEGRVNSLLVIAPAGVYRTWVTQAKEHLAPALYERLLVHVFASGAGKTAERERTEFMRNKSAPRLLLVNIEALSSVERARQLCIDFLSQGASMAVVDESTTIKNPTARRTQFINRKLAPLAKYRRILSGLPTPRSPLDLYSQFEFLDKSILGFSNYYAFRSRYAIMRMERFGGRQVPIVVGYRDVNELTKRHQSHSYRVRLEDCYDVPPKLYLTRAVQLTSPQKRIYDDIKKFATSRLSETQHVTATQVITQLLRLHQVLCGHVTDECGLQHSIPEHRTAELLSLLEEYDGKAIIWCSYSYDVQNVASTLAQEYGQQAVARFWGGNIENRETEEHAFLNNPECRFMVATASAGGRGRTWTAANLVVYYSNTHDLEHRSQSEERTQGIGKDDRCTGIDLVAPGTVDELIIKALRKKISMAAVINGDNYKEWLI